MATGRRRRCSKRIGVRTPINAPDSKSAGRTLIALGVALTLAGVMLTWRHLRPLATSHPPLSATQIEDARPLPPFVLHEAGGTLTNADLTGRWTLLDFGYTSCPDICPTTLATLKDVKARLAAAGLAPPQVIFISVDPLRDSPQRLKDYVQFFDPAFRGATGDDDALAPLAKDLGVYYQRLDEKDKRHYAVDHSAVIYLIDPQGRLRATFSWPHDPAAIAADYRRIIGG